ncbi:MAG: acetyl-CoA C-acyltransferase [Bacteroidetes bacterium]|nr:acetyl-CoA C-acyltransferase [Bacteroidota bacterium]
MKEAFIVDTVRSAVGRAGKGSLSSVRPEALGGDVIRALLARNPSVDPNLIDDVLVGCAMPEGAQGMNLGRLVAQKAGLPDSVPGATINRFCSSGLQTIALAAQSIATGMAQTIIAGGVESMSLVPMTGYYYQPDPDLIRSDPNVYVSMGNTAENVAEKYSVSRLDQDAFALRSHQKAFQAVESGVFHAEIVPLSVKRVSFEDGKRVESEFVFDHDEGPRKDSTAEALAALRPVFRANGSVTAGNSSQMSDGGAATLMVSGQMLKDWKMQPMARLVSFAVGGVAPELMGIGPIEAIPKALKLAGLQISDLGLIELNEAFASQSLAVIRHLNLNPEIVNVHGGAIALGHPLGCTGAKLTATLLHEMKRRKVRYGLCTMCIGGGMGAAGVFENLML